MAQKKNKQSNKKKQQVSETPIESEVRVNESSSVIGSWFKNRAVVSIVLFLLSFVVFIPSLSNDFVWDDVTYIQNKARQLNYSEIGPELIAPEKKSARKAGGYFRPVHQLSLIIDNEIWDTSPFGFHLTNIILHSISTVLLYLLILLLLKEFKIKGREPIALISSVLFALYPLHVESVSFISARGDILAAMFFFLAISFYVLSYRKLFYLLLAGICFLLSFLSKEVAVVLPVIIIAFDLITRRFLKRTNLFKYIVIILIILFYLVIRSQSYKSFSEIITQSGSELSVGFLGIVELFFNTYLFYIIRLIFPYNLNPYIEFVPDWGLVGVGISLIIVLALFAAVFQSIKKKENLTAFSIIWILATLLPAAAVAILSLALTKLADRFLYIPSAAICIIFGYIIYRFSVRLGRAWISYAITAVLAVSFLVVTIDAQKIWKNNLTLWEYVLSKSPNAMGAKLNYANALRASGNYSEALKQYIDISQNDSQLNKKAKMAVIEGLVVAYTDTGNYQQSEKWLDVALSYSDGYEARYYYMKGFIALRRNDPVSAESYFLKSLETEPSSNTYYFLGGIYFIDAQQKQSLERYKKAEEYLNKSVEINPFFSEASLLLSKTYLALGDKQKAKLNAQNALKNAKSQEVVNEAQLILQMK